MGADWLPRRHFLQKYSVPDRSCPRTRVGIRQERKRRDIPRPMTCLAMLLKDPNDLFVECHGWLSVDGAPKNKKDDGCCECFEPHAGYFTSRIAKNSDKQLFALLKGRGGAHLNSRIREFRCAPPLPSSVRRYSAFVTSVRPELVRCQPV